MAEIKKSGFLATGAEVRLLTDAFEGPDKKFMPVLPLGYAAFDWHALGVKATAQAVSPIIHPEELGGMEDFTGTRHLHAKVVLMEGTRTGLAYLGSANFTARGWGFLTNHVANVEAGLILRRSMQGANLENLIPDLAGQPILLGDGNKRILRAPENGPADEPWPEFIRQILLSPTAKDENELELLIEVAPGSAEFIWSMKLIDKEGIPSETILSVESTRVVSRTTYLVNLSPQNLTRLLTEQEVLICWKEYPSGRLVPLNIESSARTRLPISPGNNKLEESSLLCYYQGRISWEELFPDPEVAAGQNGNAALPAGPISGVDKSRIQSYQVREFVEALTGLRQDLEAANRTESSMRLALLGPVSPFALAQTILEATRSGRRTPTAAAFQIVEILSCLKSARTFSVPEKLLQAWEQYLSEATQKVGRILEQIFSSDDKSLHSSKAFGRYRKTVLGGFMFKV